MAEHVLKTLAPYWDAVARGDKTFEVRRDDRGFQRGDTLILRRLAENHGGYDVDYETRLPRSLRKTVSYVLTGGQFGVEPGYVVLGLSDAALSASGGRAEG